LAKFSLDLPFFWMADKIGDIVELKKKELATVFFLYFILSL